MQVINRFNSLKDFQILLVLSIILFIIQTRILIQGYGSGAMAPGIEGLGTTAYQAAHNQIRAHAKAYRYKYSGTFIIIFVK